MIQLSVKISEQLYQQLQTKTEEMALPYISDTIRVLLNTALTKPAQEAPQNLQHKILEHVVTSYYLLREQLTHTEHGFELNQQAHEKSKGAMHKILRQEYPFTNTKP